MRAGGAPFEQVFFDWFGGMASAGRAASSPAAAHYAGETFIRFENALRNYVPSNPQRLEHAYFAGGEPCTMMIDEVERIWTPIAATDDWSAFHDKLHRIDTMADAYGTILR
jgi:hypothetical protein